MAFPLNIIIVERLGALKLLSIKDFKEEELFKKCGFKKAEDFVKQTTWSVKQSGQKYTVEVFAKSEGRPNSENKYDFPPPVDNKIFYGQCLLVNPQEALTIVEWEKIYEELMGGFEDINSDSDVSEEETEGLNLTKEGYVKDGFVVSDSEE